MQSTGSEFGLSEIGQISLTITDLDRAVGFYRDTLGLKHLFSAPPGLAFFSCGTVRLMLSRPESEEAERFSAALYFKVAVIEAAAAGPKKRRATFEAAPHLVAPHRKHEYRMGGFRDS